MKMRNTGLPVLCAALGLSLAISAGAIESLHYGLNGMSNYPALTDALRLSTRIGAVWWTSRDQKTNVENGKPVPYAFHDGTVKWIGQSGHPADTSPEACAKRWRQIKAGGADPWLAGSPTNAGVPGIIVLDEINNEFNDSRRGGALREALRIYTTKYGSTNDIVLFASPSLSMGVGVKASNYSNVIFCANHYVRWFALEIYCSYQGFLTGRDPVGKATFGTGDKYLAQRLSFGIRNWTTTMGVSPAKVMAFFTVGTFADAHDKKHPDFCAFLNREFWFLANGWYDAAHSAVDENLKTVLRNGVGSYTFTPGDREYQMPITETKRDDCLESFIFWYCVSGKTNAAPERLAVPP